MNTLAATHIGAFIAARKMRGRSNSRVNRGLEVLSAATNRVNRDLDWGLPNPVSGRKLQEPEGRTGSLSFEYAHLAPERVRNAVRILENVSRFGHAGSEGVSEMTRNALKELARREGLEPPTLRFEA